MGDRTMTTQSQKMRNKYYRILSFDGGGVRGVLPAIILERMSQSCPRLVENTDLFVGTSVGSFIALALASGKSPDEIVTLFSYKNIKSIFCRPRSFYFFRPKYKNEPLKKLLLEIFSPTLRLKDLPYRVVVPAFRLYSKDAKIWEPVFFNNFPSSKNADTLVVDAALASSAAPIYFPSYKRYIDGGVVSNNPDIVAISYAVSEHAAYAKLKDVVHLSFGTGWNPQKIKQKTKNWGLIQWMYSLRASDTTPKLPLFNVFTDGDVASDMYVTRNLLNDRYMRVSPTLHERIHLDDYTKVPTLIEIANEYDLRPAITFARAYWSAEKINFRAMKHK